MVNKEYTLSKIKLYELFDWLFEEGFWSALDKDENLSDPYGSSRRDAAVQKVFNRLNHDEKK